MKSYQRTTFTALAICIYVVFFHYEVDIIDQGASIFSLPHATGDHEYFTLCNKKLYLKDMPRGDAESAESNVTFFGVREWKHDNLNKAIAIENRFGKRDGGTQNVVRVYGRTGNQIQEFFHVFDMFVCVFFVFGCF